MVEAEAVVETASEAAHGYVFSRLNKSTVDDIDLAVSFEDGVLEVEVSIVAPDADPDLERIAEDAVRVAGDAVDELFEQA
ncbi:MAG: DUF3194 domain-containing protein [Halodesulfurarchaeum sp.]